MAVGEAPSPHGPGGLQLAGVDKVSGMVTCMSGKVQAYWSRIGDQLLN